MSLDREQKVRGNLIPEGVVVPHSASWPPDAADGQMHWHLPEQRMYVYDLAGDYWVPVGTTTQFRYEPVTHDYVYLNGRTFAQVRAGAFFQRWRNTSVVITGGPTTEWDALWRYTYWQFARSGSATWTSLTQFSTENAFYTFLEGFIPSAGGVYLEGVQFRAVDSVNDADPYPSLVRHRNSLVASLRGRHNWTRGPQHGVDANFNSPTYYANFYNEVAQRFVLQNPGQVAPSNNDGAVWYHRGSRGTLWRWPLVDPGNVWPASIYVSPGYRGAAWDSVALTWVTSAPPGHYELQNPFFLIEYQPYMLTISTGTDPAHRSEELWRPMALVFPAVLGGRYYGYVVVPHGADTVITDKLDSGNHDLYARFRYRHDYHQVIYGPINEFWGSDAEHSLFNFRLFPFFRDATGAKQSTDKDSIPTKIDIFRRSRSTGMRSRFFTVFNITRRINHAAFRMDPAARHK